MKKSQKYISETDESISQGPLVVWAVFGEFIGTFVSIRVVVLWSQLLFAQTKGTFSNILWCYVLVCKGILCILYSSTACCQPTMWLSVSIILPISLIDKLFLRCSTFMQFSKDIRGAMLCSISKAYSFQTP